MTQEIDLIVKSEFIEIYKEGYPLISKESIVSWDKVRQEGSVVNLVDEKGKFILKGYHGIQNKGYGWALSMEKHEKIDSAYFSKKIKSAVEYRKDFYNEESTTAFRVLNGEGDGLGGLTIDYFDGYYLLTWYSLGIYEFKSDILEALKNSVKYKAYLKEAKRFVAPNKKTGKYSDDPQGKEQRRHRDLELGIKSISHRISEGKKYTFGVEIETCSGFLRRNVYEENRLNLECTHDGSIEGGEYVTGILTGVIIPILMIGLLYLIKLTYKKKNKKEVVDKWNLNLEQDT